MAVRPADPRRRVSQLQQARRTCAPGCFGYHATWPACRRLGIKSHPGWHQTFIASSLSGHPDAAIRPLDVVIAGAADDMMLTTLARVALPHPPRIHLIDRCATPLARNTAAALQLGLRLTTEQRDLAAAPTATRPGQRHTDSQGWPQAAASADLLVTDGLLSLLPSHAAVDDLLRRVADLLRPGGRFCYTTRLTARPNHNLEYDLIGRILHTGTTLAYQPCKATQRWATARRTWFRPARPAPFTTIDDLVSTVTDAGLAVLDIEHDTAPPSAALAVHPNRLTATASTIVRLRAEAQADH
ncbi:class I SAM-dependent methyltransferase [Frankia sp. R43]|uniref:class I SAM-dependent methyltransferase n=1 Tax=Frankia sp. R43 TaxID=269536 RepID=UPI00128F5BD7|nr:class I SAM-dependent methyltransferase [Frankia sp. R43]